MWYCNDLILRSQRIILAVLLGFKISSMFCSNFFTRDLHGANIAPFLEVLMPHRISLMP